VYHTAASFVSTRAGLEPRGLLTGEQIFADVHSATNKSTVLPRGTNRLGGIIVVGSYVPKTTKQLSNLLQTCLTENILVDASKIISLHRSNPADNDVSLKTIENDIVLPTAKKIDEAINAGKDVVLYTSREFSTGAELSDTALVSKAITDIVSKLTVRPHFIVSKGGITSFEVAKIGLGVKIARVLGQIEPGVPVWRLDNNNYNNNSVDSSAKFPGVPYVVFPGNVGSEDALSRVAQKLGVRKTVESANKIIGKPLVIGDYRDKWTGKQGMLEVLKHARRTNRAVAGFNICEFH
jgi:uncharacterized protein YgbK (DUF1537 family)